MMRILALSNKFMPKILLLFLVTMVTAASYSGWFSKWQFRDNDSRLGFECVFDGDAHKPFIYRQLLPMTTKIIVDDILPDNAKFKLDNSKFIEQYYGKGNPSAKHHAEYVILYVMCYLALFASAIILAVVLTEATRNKVAGFLASLIFILIFPLLETFGGYYYDFFELLFFTVSIYLSVHGRWVLLLLLIPVAELNKESFLFYIPLMYPFLRNNFSRYKSCLFVMLGIILSGIAYCWIRQQYLGNAGGMVEFHLVGHLQQLFDWRSYVARETNYGIITGARMSFVYIIIVAYIVGKTWCILPGKWKIHAKIAMAIQLPLYILFCWPGELRNLSMLYLSFCVMLAFYVDRVLKNNIKVGRNM